MFGNQPFYFALIKKYVSLFGVIFSDIEIVRTVDGTTPDQVIKVPISYAPKDKTVSIIKADPAIKRPFSISLPTMSFEYLGLKYDPTRKLNTLGKTVRISSANTGQTLSYQYNPVPYNFNFELYVYVKNTEDATKIVEQIVPFFTPDWTPSVELIPELGVVLDTPIILTDVRLTDQYEGDFVTRQVLIYTLSFVIKGYLFGPIKDQPVIKFANVSFYVPNSSITEISDAVGNTKPSDRVTIQPGQLANGQPTSNLQLTIPYNNIIANSDFGYCIDVSGILINGNTAG